MLEKEMENIEGGIRESQGFGKEKKPRNQYINLVFILFW